MRFPLRLTLDLSRVVIAQKLFGTARRPLVLPLDLAKVPASANVDSADASDSSRDLQALAMVGASSAPIVWIGGDTPLHYPRIGHLTREIIDLGRNVFIEMDGRLLRRRIHEFRPVSRLYLALPLLGLQDEHDLRAGHPGSFRATIESLRTAKLSGFHVCVETPIFSDTDLDEIRVLANFINTLGVDGWIQKIASITADDEPLKEMFAAARDLIHNSGWKSLSRHLALGAQHAEVARGQALDFTASPETRPADQIKREVPTREESVRAL